MPIPRTPEQQYPPGRPLQPELPSNMMEEKDTPLDEKSDFLGWQTTRTIAVELALEQGDIDGLRKWSAEPGGFGTDEIRRKVWPVLLDLLQPVPAGIKDEVTKPAAAIGSQSDSVHPEIPDADSDSDQNASSSTTQPTIPRPKTDPSSPHPDERQVSLDTNRSFVYYPEGLSDTEKKRLQGELNELIVEVLRRRRGLSYFQGYHDIISILYLTFFPYTPPPTPSLARTHSRNPSLSLPSSRSHSLTRTGSNGFQIERIDRSGSRSNPGSRSSSRLGRGRGSVSSESRRGSVSKSPGEGMTPLRGSAVLPEEGDATEAGKNEPAQAEGKKVEEEDDDSPDRGRGSIRKQPSESAQTNGILARNPSPKSNSSKHPERWKQLVDACEAVSLLRIRDGMGKGLGPVVGYLRILKRLVKAADKDLAKLVNKVSPTPYFALSWMLTLFSHDCDNFVPVQRIFDYLLARNPAMVIYMGVAIVLLKKDRLTSLGSTLDEDPGILHTNLSLLPPLIADSPGDPIPISPTSPRKATTPSKEYLDPHAPNPLEPVALSELFKLTDTLWERYPLNHPEVKAEEIMGSKSVIVTYQDRISTAEGNDKRMSLEDARKWVENGVVEEEVVITPPLPESDDEEEAPPTPPVNRRRRPIPVSKKRQPPILGRTTLVLAVLFVGAGILAYQGRRRGASMEYLLGIMKGRQTFDIFQDIWDKVRAGRVGERTVWGRIKDLL